MAEKVFNGKTWNIRLANGELLRDKKTGRLKHCNKESMADFWAETATEREENPRPPSWRQALSE